MRHGEMSLLLYIKTGPLKTQSESLSINGYVCLRLHKLEK
jgi:hypothetical protein